jgi:hypothetical protein
VPDTGRSSASTTKPLRFSVDVADIGELRFLAFALLVQLGLGFRRGGMRVVATLLAVEIALAVAAGRRRVARPVLRHQALHRSPRLNLRAVDREVLVREKGAHLPVGQKFGEELARHLSPEQPVAVLAEHRRNPDRIIDAQADKPAIKQIVLQLLHQLPC